VQAVLPVEAVWSRGLFSCETSVSCVGSVAGGSCVEQGGLCQLWGLVWAVVGGGVACRWRLCGASGLCQLWGLCRLCRQYLLAVLCRASGLCPAVGQMSRVGSVAGELWPERWDVCQLWELSVGCAGSVAGGSCVERAVCAS
jgi:hypothetical protein